MDTSIVDPRWKDLYKLAGIVAIVSEFVILLGIVTFFIWPYTPGNKTTEEILRFLQSDPLGGLVSLDLFLFVGNLFSVFLFLALYVSLRPVNPSYALVALAVGLIGLVLLIPARPIVELFALSRQYAAATTDAARSQVLAAGDALLALFDGTNWFMNTLLGALSLLTSSLRCCAAIPTVKPPPMLASSRMPVCGFFIPTLGKFLLFLSLPGYMIWYFLLARRFFQMGRDN